jgi:hypothetical protein
MLSAMDRFFDSPAADTQSGSQEFTWPGPDQGWFGLPDDQNENLLPFLGTDPSGWIV